MDGRAGGGSGAVAQEPGVYTANQCVAGVYARDPASPRAVQPAVEAGGDGPPDRLRHGVGGYPRAILRWADRRGWDVRIVAIDLHRRTVEEAMAGNADPRLHIVQGNVLSLPFEDNQFDYALTAMFLHHLDDEAVVAVLRTMSRVARRGIIAADLIRNRRAYGWVSLLSLLANPMVRHDARISVAQAFTEAEVRDFAERKPRLRTISQALRSSLCAGGRKIRMSHRWGTDAHG